MKNSTLLICLLLFITFFLGSCEDKSNPYGLNKEFPFMDYDSVMSNRPQNDKPVLIYFNSIGCVNCICCISHFNLPWFICFYSQIFFSDESAYHTVWSIFINGTIKSSTSLAYYYLAFFTCQQFVNKGRRILFVSAS